MKLTSSYRSHTENYNISIRKNSLKSYYKTEKILLYNLALNYKNEHIFNLLTVSMNSSLILRFFHM